MNGGGGSSATSTSSGHNFMSNCSGSQTIEDQIKHIDRIMKVYK